MSNALDDARLRITSLARENERLRLALKPLAALADRKEYTLDDVPHEWAINAKLALGLEK